MIIKRTLTRDYHISHFKVGDLFYFEGVACCCRHINIKSNEITILCINRYADLEGKFLNPTKIKLK